MEEITFREEQVLDFVCLGYSNQEIANKMFLSIRTIASHIDNVVKKINISEDKNKRVALVLYWLNKKGNKI